MRNPFVNSTDQQAGEQIGDDPTKYGDNSCLVHVGESYQSPEKVLNVLTQGNTLATPGLESSGEKPVNKGTPSSVHAKRATFWGRGSVCACLSQSISSDSIHVADLTHKFNYNWMHDTKKISSNLL